MATFITDSSTLKYDIDSDRTWQRTHLTHKYTGHAAPIYFWVFAHREDEVLEVISFLQDSKQAYPPPLHPQFDCADDVEKLLFHCL